jgi:parallel beta-helix repeat protein
MRSSRKHAGATAWLLVVSLGCSSFAQTALTTSGTTIVAPTISSGTAITGGFPWANSFTYYVDAATGSDSNPGTQSLPFQTIAKVNTLALTSGQSVGFKRGSIWRETLTTPSSGSAGSPITFGAYGTGALPIISGANLVTGTWTASPTGTTAASGSVTQANMRLSLVSGTSFVDFGTSLSSYLGDQITITDHAGKNLIGYLKAAGTGETYGAELLSNTDFATTTGVSVWFNVTLASVAGGQSGNALQLTQTGGGFGQAYETFTTVNGGLYRGSVYMKFGTETSLMGWSFFTPGPGSAVRTQNAAPSTFTNFPLYFSAAGTSYLQAYTANTNATTSLFDTATVKQVLTPSTTGATITTTANGSTSGWTSEDVGFNRNDSGGYTYTVTAPGAPPNVWQITWTTQPKIVAINGAPSLPVGSLVNVTTAGSWYWSSNVLYVYSTSSPATAYTNPGVEASFRANGVDINAKSYLKFQNLQVQFAQTPGFTTATAASNITIDGSTIYYNGGTGIGAPTGSNNWTVSNNQLSYNGGGQGLGLSSGDNMCLLCSVGATGSGFQVYGNTSTNGYGDGIYINGSGHSVHGNTFANNGNSGFGYGIELICSSTEVYNNDVSGSNAGYSAIELNGGDNNYVHNNVVHGNVGSGIALDAGISQVSYNVVYGNTTSNTAGILLNGSNGSLVANNTLYGNYIGLQLYATTTSATIKNNLVVSNSTVGIGFASGAAGTLSYNDVYGNVSVNYFGLTDPTGTSNNISANPLFTNPAGHDFTLQDGSPAIGTGVYISSVSTSLTPNIGAK